MPSNREGELEAGRGDLDGDGEEGVKEAGRGEREGSAGRATADQPRRTGVEEVGADVGAGDEASASGEGDIDGRRDPVGGLWIDCDASRLGDDDDDAAGHISGAMSGTASLFEKLAPCEP